MEQVYLYDESEEEVVGMGKKNASGCVVVKDESLADLSEFVVIPKDSFYQHEAVQDVVPTGTGGTQVMVECMACGFETVYGVLALIRDNRWNTERNGYPKFYEGCKECGENVWKEVRRQAGPCDWSDEFDWAEPPEA